MATKAERERQEARERLREILTRGQEVSCVLRHVSRSGMMRHISLLVVDENGEIRDISYWAGQAIGSKLANDGGIKVGGCGMDMGFHLVYTLARAVFGDLEPTPEEKANHPKWTSAEAHYGYGGYALKHRWV